MTPTYNIHRISTPVHGRVMVRQARIRNETASTPLLLSFHGYSGTAAGNMNDILNIDCLDSWTVAAVQALHLFYIRHTKKGGDIGGCWMTAQDRKYVIADNIVYIDTVIATLRDTYETGHRLVYMGFSQGAATAWRFACMGKAQCSELIVVGGAIPPELTDEDLKKVQKVLLARGVRDSWYTSVDIRIDEQRLRNLGISVSVFEYNAAHEWADDLFTYADTWLKNS